MSTTTTYQLLEQITSPEALRQLDPKELGSVAEELRSRIIDIVSEHGGHLSASLGVVELTVALHYLFKTPDDALIWDVGHQAYGHKILTGRNEQFEQNRKWQGLSGFPKRDESPFDVFGTGHSSTSLSAAAGMAMAKRLSEISQSIVAVIGDGALTGGMAYEALNYIGGQKLDVIIILNDNSMSIDENVGALKDHLDGLRNQQISESIFEQLGISYRGPIDGHDLPDLLRVLSETKEEKGPRIIHCITRKGKGYLPAETGDQPKWHAPGTFDRTTGEPISRSVTDHPPKFQEVFGETLLELVRDNDQVVGITPAMPSGSSMNIVMDEYPERIFDVGIAEQHAVTFAAGMTINGYLPFCNIYSTFLQRGYDQVIHDVALQKLKVIFCIDRAGLVGEDGATHQGVFDLAFLRIVPNLIVSAPMDEVELRNLLYTAQTDAVSGPMAIRYPRGRGWTTDWKRRFQAIEIGMGRVLQEGSTIAVLSIGASGRDVSVALEQLGHDAQHVTHADMRFVKPMDEALLHQVCRSHRHIITVEDGCLNGGFGSAVLEFMQKHDYRMPINRLGIPDAFIEQGSPSEQKAYSGIDSASIQRAIQSAIKKS